MDNIEGPIVIPGTSIEKCNLIVRTGGVFFSFGVLQDGSIRRNGMFALLCAVA